MTDLKTTDERICTSADECGFVQERLRAEVTRLTQDLLVGQQEKEKAEDDWIRIATQNARDATARYAALEQGIAQVIEAMQHVAAALSVVGGLKHYATEWAETLSRLLAPQDENKEEKNDQARVANDGEQR